MFNNKQKYNKYRRVDSGLKTLINKRFMSKVKLMFIVLPSWDMPHLTGRIKNTLDSYTSEYSVVKSKEEYYACKDRHTYTVIAVWGLPGFSKEVINDQMENN